MKNRNCDGWILFAVIVLTITGIWFVADSGLVQRLAFMRRENIVPEATPWLIKLAATVAPIILGALVARLRWMGAGAKAAIQFCLLCIMILGWNYSQRIGLYNNAYTQALVACFGGMFMAFIVSLPRRFVYWSVPVVFWYVVIVLMLIAVLIIGKVTNGAKSWIPLGSFSLQPSEFAKPVLIYALAYIFSDPGWLLPDNTRRVFGYNVPSALLAGFLCFLFVVLTVLQKDVGTSIVILVPSVFMFFMAGARIRIWAFVILLAAMVAGGVYIYKADPDTMRLPDYIKGRVKACRDPFDEDIALTSGFQSRNALMAMSRGHIAGVGPLKGDIKRSLSECHTDYIYTTIAEESGFIGSCFLLLMYAILIFRGFKVARKARNRFSMLILTGCSAFFAVQMFVNLGGVTTLIPATGVPLPFVSSGGSSLLASMFMAAMMLHASKYIDLRE
ncbi:MAG: FtsW/RodA/SpoVE family cell cycle protein [Abditibacteriota bacterium]|nr:FtsW/RodA/SpoVE family cell cycle protein [Abditibacteriota bacterium]